MHLGFMADAPQVSPTLNLKRETQRDFRTLDSCRLPTGAAKGPNDQLDTDRKEMEKLGAQTIQRKLDSSLKWYLKQKMSFEIHVKKKC